MLISHGRQHSELVPPHHAHVKAGASNLIAQRAMEVLSPSFDSNRNDIWSKRMNTLRKFISIISKLLIRKRVTERMGKVISVFADNNVTTKEEAREFINKENANHRGGGSSASSGKKGSETLKVRGSDSEVNVSDALANPSSVASMVCALPSEELKNRTDNEDIIASRKFEVSERNNLKMMMLVLLVNNSNKMC